MSQVKWPHCIIAILMCNDTGLKQSSLFLILLDKKGIKSYDEIELSFEDS